MKIPVKLYEVDRATGAKPKFTRDFSIIAPTIELCRKMVLEKIRGEGYTLRTISFSPNPAPTGSVIVYVFTKEGVASPEKPAKRRRRR
jgi:hypothetical protein